jgi:hypothetical protein
MDLDREIQALVSRFTDDVAALSLQAARDALAGAFGGSKGTTTGNVIARGRGVKRDQDQLEALRTKLMKTIEANPGRRIEEIGKALGLPTKELALPVRQLLALKVITKKGKKRATTYHPRG